MRSKVVTVVTTSAPIICSSSVALVVPVIIAHGMLLEQLVGVSVVFALNNWLHNRCEIVKERYVGGEG